jgi:hypothetical protein
LSVPSIPHVREEMELELYMTKKSMDFWSNVSEEVVTNNFPQNLCVRHTHAAYHEIKREIEVSPFEILVTCFKSM